MDKTMQNRQSNWAVGYLDDNAQAHGQTIQAASEAATGTKATHDVVVAVFVDGHLQFAGGDAYGGPVPTRVAAKRQAREILGRMGEEGDCVVTEERHD